MRRVLIAVVLALVACGETPEQEARQFLMGGIACMEENRELIIEFLGSKGLESPPENVGLEQAGQWCDNLQFEDLSDEAQVQLEKVGEALVGEIMPSVMAAAVQSALGEGVDESVAATLFDELTAALRRATQSLD